MTIFRSLLFLLPFFYLCSSENSTQGALQGPKNRLYNPLVCYVETEGQLYDEEYHESQRHEPCGPDVKYCQKITAHFISAGGEITKITMKGCDTVSVSPHFIGLPCKGNGCSERSEGEELYNVCCCNSETCNSSSQIPLLTSVIILIIRFIFF